MIKNAAAEEADSAIRWQNARMAWEKEIEVCRRVSRKAGKLALEHAARGVESEDKADDSPVTEADRACEETEFARFPMGDEVPADVGRRSEARGVGPEDVRPEETTAALADRIHLDLDLRRVVVGRDARRGRRPDVHSHR